MQNANLKTTIQNYKTDVKLRAYQFSLDIIQCITEFPEKKIYWVIGDQLLRAATSIGANIVEAKSSSSKREFIKYYEIALKSSNEVKYWLCLLRDSNLTPREQVEVLLNEVIQISKLLGASIITMKNKRVVS